MDDTQENKKTKISAEETRASKPERDLSMTQQSSSNAPTRPVKTSKFAIAKKYYPIIGFVITVIILGFSILISGYWGYSRGNSLQNQEATAASFSILEQEYQRGLSDMESGNYYIAMQRFEYIFELDPTFNLALDRWVEIQLLLSSTATPTLLPPTPTATPLPNGIPVDELFATALSHIHNQNWSLALGAISALRNSDPTYRVTQVDGMIYLALRNQGADFILNQGRFEEGLYDFTLAEQFGPIDIEAESYRSWARLYLQGNGFWMAYPDLAALYYGQLSGLVPNLSDSSGLTAFYRYWASLIQYAEQLAGEEDWCGSNEQYQIADAAAGLDEIVRATSVIVQENCYALTATVTPTVTSTMTITPTVTGTLMTETATPTITITAEFTGTVTQTPTVTLSPTITTTPTITLTSTVTETPANTPTPTNTNTPTNTPTPTWTPSTPAP